jgi:hypothetical protein
LKEKDSISAVCNAAVENVSNHPNRKAKIMKISHVNVAQFLLLQHLVQTVTKLLVEIVVTVENVDAVEATGKYLEQKIVKGVQIEVVVEKAVMIEKKKEMKIVMKDEIVEKEAMSEMIELQKALSAKKNVKGVLMGEIVEVKALIERTDSTKVLKIEIGIVIEKTALKREKVLIEGIEVIGAKKMASVSVTKTITMHHQQKTIETQSKGIEMM